MSENFNSHIACEGTDNDINWVCKVCKDLPNYAGMYLYQREREKNQLKNVKDRRADLILLKYYYALLHLLDKIHELHECPNPENDVPKYADRKCSTPECFVYYRYIYNTYASILMTEKGLNQINLRCDICSVLPYTIFSVLEKKTLVYMDFGVYQLYESNEVFHTQLDNYAEMDEIQFVYSPTHMEEVCRMDNSIFEGKRRDNISKICSNCEVFLVRDGCLKILTEPVEVCFDRAKKLQVLNQYAEESECATFEALEEKTCGLLRWDEKEVETHRKEISLLTSTQLFDPKNEMIDNESINRVFYEICGSRFPVEDFKDYCKKERTFSEIREAVRLLFILMNALGYHRNKIEKRTKFTYKAFYPTYDREFYRTIRSGFYDVDHICWLRRLWWVNWNMYVSMISSKY